MLKKFDILKGWKTVLGITGLVAVGILGQYNVLPDELAKSLDVFFQGLVGIGLTMKLQRWIGK
jgi:hypothetical protein